AGCFVECKGKLLYLRYAMDHPTESGKWGIPGGKLEEGESLTEGALREIFEETSIRVSKANYVGHLFIRKRGVVEYIFHMFHIQVTEAKVRLSNEHTDYRWLTAEEVKQLSIVGGG